MRIGGHFEGVALLDRLLTLAHRRKLQTIVMSSSNDVTRLAVQRGVDDFLSKPVVKELFQKRVETLERLAVLNELANDKEATQLGDGDCADPITLRRLLDFWKEPEHVAFPRVRPSREALVSLSSWQFDAFAHSEDELCVLALAMFEHFDLVQLCQASTDVFERLVMAVRQGYGDHPYHNWRHAFDVAQATFVFLVRHAGPLHATPTERLALLVAALCHDLGHPGCNNDYLVKTESEVAQLYNHRSVLENCHSFMLFRMLEKRPELDVFAGLPAENRTQVQKIVMECILATDPSAHFQYVFKLGAIASLGEMKPDERLSVMQCVIKMTDISNVARAFEGPGARWSELVNEEFFNQGDALRSCGMAVPEFLDRHVTTVATNSVSFINGLALPLFKALGRLFPEFDTEVVALLVANKAKWENVPTP